MAQERKTDRSCARVKQYHSSDVGQIERHNERKNEDYGNVNVVPERIPFNVHYRTPQASYMDTLRALEAEGKVSLRGLRQDATLFDEIVLDVNTAYFERHGGYEYAKKFYGEAYRFIEKKFGSDYVISAVMHADEFNRAESDKMGKEVYHYHLHAVVIPVVEKEIRWSKRCKDPALRGTVREVIHQISHSKRWKSDVVLTDEQGNTILRKNGKPRFRPSYSVLQDEFYEHMREHGFTDFERGEAGSTSEHLTSLQYQIEKDKERLSDLEDRIGKEQTRYESAHEVYKTTVEIEEMGQKTLTGKVAVSKEDYQTLTALAKEGITSRGEISRLHDSVSYYQRSYANAASALERMRTRYEELKEKCRPFLVAVEHFPNLVKVFIDRVKELFAEKEARELKEREERYTGSKGRQRLNRGGDNPER